MARKEQAASSFLYRQGISHSARVQYTTETASVITVIGIGIGIGIGIVEPSIDLL